LSQIFLLPPFHLCCSVSAFVGQFVEFCDRNSTTTTTKHHSHKTALSQARYRLAATSSGELVFFAGGRNSTGQPSDRVDIYNVTNGSWTTATLSIPRGALAATSSQNLVFFGGGWSNGFSSTPYDRVDIYNTLKGSWRTANLSISLLSCSHFCWKSCSLWRRCQFKWLFQCC
jgi:hypothetical protein